MATVTAPLDRFFPEAPGAFVQIAINYALTLESRTDYGFGLGEQDRLAGDGGGLSRHQIRVAADTRNGPWGANLSATWRQGFRIRERAGVDSASDLVTADFATVDLRVSRDIASASGGGDRQRAAAWCLEAEIRNLTAAWQKARRADGGPVDGYGRFDRDPRGRAIQFSLSRRF